MKCTPILSFEYLRLHKEILDARYEYSTQHFIKFEENWKAQKLLNFW